MSKGVLLTVLNRAAEDCNFYSQLVQDHTEALKDYELSTEEAMRISTGDVRWIEFYLGMKIDPQVMKKVFIPMLSREVW